MGVEARVTYHRSLVVKGLVFLLGLAVLLAALGILWSIRPAPAGAQSPAASRSISPASVLPGVELTVTVTASGYGSEGGRIEETLPAGFSYVAGSASPADVRVTQDGQTVRFTTSGADRLTLTYRVRASRVNGDYKFAGVLRDFQLNQHTIGGASDVTVGRGATRSFSAGTVRTGSGLTVTIAAGGYGELGGRVEETLPSGFAYVDGSVRPADIRVTEQDRVVRFTFVGISSFTYGVNASVTPGSHAFSGVLLGDQRARYVVAGADTVVVEAAPVVQPRPTATRRAPRRGGGGGGGIRYVPPSTPTPAPTLAPPTPKPTPTMVPPTPVPTLTVEQLAMLKGDPGEKGDKGDKGDKGEKGDPGLTGSKGPQGDPGEKGSEGQPGDKGPRGDEGDHGQVGAAGESGSMSIWAIVAFIVAAVALVGAIGLLILRMSVR